VSPIAGIAFAFDQKKVKQKLKYKLLPKQEIMMA